MIPCPWCKQTVQKDNMWVGNTYTCSCENPDVNEHGYSFLVEFGKDTEIIMLSLWLILKPNIYLLYTGNHRGNIWSITIDDIVEDDWTRISEGIGSHMPEEATNLLTRYKKLMAFT